MNYLQIFNFIHSRLVPVEIPTEEEASEVSLNLDAKECTSFQELCEHFKKQDEDDVGLHWTQEIESTLACMCAVVLSTPIPGGQLGLRVQGPPGSCKSVLAECLSQDREYVYPRDTFTGIITGWHSISKSKNLAAKLNHKCLFIKEADALIQQPNLKQIESELRSGLGDGVIRGEYRTGKVVEIESLFTCCMFGTRQLRLMDNAALGSRFLDIIIHDNQEHNEKIVKSAIRNAQQAILSHLSADNQDHNRKAIIAKAAPYCMGFLQHKFDLIASRSIRIKPLTEAQEDQIYAMGELAACCRAKVTRRRDQSLEFEPERELGTRIAEQLVRFAFTLCIVLYSPSRKYSTANGSTTNGEIINTQVNNPILNIIRKLVADTSWGYRFDLIKLLTHGDQSASQVATHFGFTIQHARTSILNDAKQLGIITTYDKKEVSGKGRPTERYRLTEEIKELWKRAKL